MYSNIRDRAMRSVKWSALGQWTTRTIQFVLLLFMARFLTPGEYGIFELTVLVVALAKILQDFGLSRSLIQTQVDIELASNIIFWANIVLSFIVYGLVIFLAPIIALTLGEVSVTLVLRVAALQIIILSFRSVHLARAQRRLLYRQQFLAEFFGSIAVVLAVIVFSLSGLRLWAFIYGLLIGSLVQTVVYWLVDPWRPSLQIDINRLESWSLLRFGGLAAVESLQGWLLNYGDNLIVGYILGVETLGVYAMAYNIAVYSFTVVLLPLTSIAYSSFSNLQSSIAEIRRAFLNIIQIVAMIIIPMGVGIVLIASQISQILLADRWTGIVVVIQLLALFTGGISHLLFINPEVYRAIGKPDVMPKLLLVTLIFSFPVYVFGAQFGLMGFVIARISVTLVFFPVHVILASKLLNSSVIEYWRRIKFPVFAAIVMVFISMFFNSIMSHLLISIGWIRLILHVLVCVVSYAVALFVIDRKHLLKVMELARSAI